MCFVVTCWERADLLALVCGVYLCHFPIGILGQVWYLIVSIPDLCTLTYFYFNVDDRESTLNNYNCFNITVTIFKLVYVLSRTQQ